jgi:hypothetical protein
LNFSAGFSGAAWTGRRSRPSALRMRYTASRFRCGRMWVTMKVRSSSGMPLARRRAHHGTLLVRRLPRQPVRSAGAVPAVVGAPFAPLANGLGANSVKLGQAAGGLGGAGVGMDREHQVVPPMSDGRPRPSKCEAYASIAHCTGCQRRSATRQLAARSRDKVVRVDPVN